MTTKPIDIELFKMIGEKSFALFGYTVLSTLKTSDSVTQSSEEESISIVYELT